MCKLMSNKDAREVLQEEINESVLRLKLAKYGHRLVDIVPDHGNSFYLPEKEMYMGKEKAGATGSTTNSQITGSKSSLARIPGLSNTNMQRPAPAPPMAIKGPKVDARALSSINAEGASSLFLTEPQNVAHPY